MAHRNALESMGRSVGTAFIIIGSLIAVAGLVWLFRTMAFVRGAAKASGQIVAVEHSRSYKGRSIYHPVFTFKDSAGIIHTQRSSLGSADYSFAAGERVTVLYDPVAPEHSMIDSFQTIWLSPVFITAFGLLFGGFACFWLWLWIRAARHRTLPDAPGDALR